MVSRRLPAFVEGEFLDVLAADPLAAALSPNVRIGENRLRSILLDPAERALAPDWEQVAPRVVQLVGELTLGSEDFRRAWARHDVKPIQSRSMRLDPPQVGELELGLSKLSPSTAPTG